MSSETGILYLIATPIGNLKDISFRALDILFSVDIILAEDTRVSAQIIERYRTLIKDPEKSSHKIRFIPFHEHNELKIQDEIINWLQEGKNIGVVSDAGTPLISDPGYKLVRECLSQGIKVEAIPGPTAVTTALILSGLPTDRFMFVGYLPRKSGQRQNFFRDLSVSPFDHITAIAFESPFRLLYALEDYEKAIGNKEIVVCRELTKLHQEVKKGLVSDIMAEYKDRTIKGEIVLVWEVENNQ